MAKNLIMTFFNAQGKKASISINNIKDNLTKEEVSSTMDTIISKNLFDTSGGDLITKDSAQIVERTASKLDIK